MTPFHNWSARTRLLLGFVAVLLPVVALLVVGAVEFHILGKSVSRIYHEAAIELRLVSAIQIRLNELMDALERYPVSRDPVVRAEIEQHLSQFQEAVSEFVKEFIPDNPEERRLVETVKGETITIQTLVLEVVAGDGGKTAQLLQRMESLERVLNRVEAVGVQEIIEARKRISRGFERVRIIALGAVLLSLVGGVLLALVFSRWIGGPIQAIARASRSMAAGDLSQRVDVGVGGEAGETAGAFNAMAERLEASHAAQRRANEELAAVNSIAGALTSSLELKQVFKVLTQRTAQAVGAERCSLNLWREGHVVPVMSQFADGHADPALWQKFRAMGPHRLEEVPAHAEAIRTKGPVVIEDATTSPLSPPYWVETFGIRAALVIPLLRQDQVIGTLNLDQMRAPCRWSQAQIDLAMTIASQAALAVENARLYEESEGRRRTSEALAAVGRDLTQSLDLAVVGQRITDRIRPLLGVRLSAFLRLEPESGDLVAVAVSENVADVFGPNLVFPKGIGAVGLAIRDRRPVVSEDVLADPRITFTPDVRARIEQASFRAVIAIPLQSKDRVIGVLSVGDEPGRVFDAEEIQLAQAFADQAAIALENARLFQEAQHALADLKAAQEQLVRGATMRALGELASGAAHHLNNLMAIVLGRVRLLLSGPESAPLRRPLEVIERAAMDATEVVRRVSRFARTQPLEDWQPLDLRQLASEVLELTRARWQDAAQAQGIRIEAAVEGSDVPPVMGNAAALREVLLNLVLNAVEALPNGGKITVRTFSEEGWVGLAVSDSGVGMSPEVRERVLEPFFTTKGPRSTGLGLSESYGIIQRHGGKLTVESAEGRGTTVTMHLPFAYPSESGGPRGEPARLPASALRILVIDDDADVREVVAEMLVALGHAVLQASGGREGLALLEAGEKMDLVLTDLGMPGMTGWDVARAVRARWTGLPVGMLTGWAEQIDEASPDRQMVAGILSKPATPEGLREFVAACHTTSRGI